MSDITYNKLNEIIERVSKKQSDCVKKYCDSAPKFVTKNVLSSILYIQRKMSGFNVISKLYAEEYKYIKCNNSRHKLYTRIYNKTKKSVDYLYKHYYYPCVENYMLIMYLIIEKVCIDEYQNKIKNIVHTLELEQFIQNHSEYNKVYGIFEIVNNLSKVKDQIYKEKSLDRYESYQELFSEYEKILDSALNIQDSNLKRAVFYYLEYVGDFQEISKELIN